MSDAKVTMTEIERATLAFVEGHRTKYLESGGRLGHVLDYRHLGGHRFTTCLLLESLGRKSAERRITPLIYGDMNGEVVIAASKGGADIHPGWYWNIKAMDQVSIQIGGQAFACTWREPEGAERERIWNFMEGIYPPYRDYQAGTQRKIPLIVFSICDEVEPFKV